MPTPPENSARPKTKKAPPRKPARAAAEKAVAEMKQTPRKPRKGDFRGVEFTVPADVPASLSFDLAEITADGGIDFGELRNLMVTLMGAEAWRAVRRKLREGTQSVDDLGDIVTELFNAVLAPYGVDLGEPSASATS
jgi:hypothetical protein